MKLSLVLQAIDRGSGPIRKVLGASRDLSRRGLDEVGRSAGRASTALDRLARTGTTRIGRLAAQARRAAGPMGLKALEKSAYGVGYAAGWALRKVGGLALGVAKIGAAGVTAAAGWGLFGMIGTASEFEQFQVVLENTEGSAAKARSAIRWVQKFARTTPYELADVLGAFVQLRAFGIDPMNGSLVALGNASAGMGKPLMQAIEMLADAQTGEFERLKEFGIRAKKSGDQVAFTYMRAGKEVTRTARNNGAEIQRAIVGIFDDRFKGMMDRQSRTLAGMWSNLKDMVAGFQLDVADNGVFDLVKGKLGAALDWVNAKGEDGTLKRWAGEIADAIERAAEQAERLIRDTDWDAVAQTVQTLAGAAWAFARALAWALDKASRLWAKVNQLEGLMASVPFSGANMLELAGGVSNIVGRWLDGDKPAAASKPAPRANRAPPRRRPAARAPFWSRGRDNPWLRPTPTGIPMARPSRGRQSSSVDVGGRIDIRLSGDGARGARVTRMSANNARVPLSAKLGPAMGGQA